MYRQPVNTGSRRKGLSLTELLIASSIMALVMGSLAALASTVHNGFDLTTRRQEILQHGRVALQRIERRLAQAWSSEQFPGFIAIEPAFAGVAFPEGLAVWFPEAGAEDPEGLPRWNELVVFCPDRRDPTQLLEVTMPKRTAVVPPADDRNAWLDLLRTFQTAGDAVRIPLTDRLRTASLSDGNQTVTRGCVRFEVTRRPSDAELEQYRAGTVAWEDLPWPMDLYSSASGTRQSWCRIELQLLPQGATHRDETLPFFGSAACHDTVQP